MIEVYSLISFFLKRGFARFSPLEIFKTISSKEILLTIKRVNILTIY